MSEAYLVLNETTFVSTDQVTTEPSSLHETLSGAVKWLAELAEQHGVDVEEDANSVYIPAPPGSGIETDEYYIIEMELKD
ncbi:hypothetical protein SEA_TREAT_57 [Streptomyces phage Treat]|uniref:Uncharacterized protein n=2 Tax=Immanueltrevirus immanuel3 TaxID=2846399 RepID=A0A2H5BMD1_9CAUD|nr:hypothetical protein SEA_PERCASTROPHE_57 [Streptomyces phage Percastrophe]AUG87490.1 hypothetical protein SEA_ROMERO_57 [Streptomyces phage Romero]UJQ86893.1 hypothetical protein SEA_TREAT_57 [Streptomyces phage Treat]